METYPEELAKYFDIITKSYFNYKKGAKIVDGVIKSCLKDAVNPSVLELGIGTGNLALEMIASGYQIEGIDHSPAMLSRAKKKLPLTQLHYCDAVDFSLGHRFDVVISHAGPLRIEYTPEREFFFETYLKSEKEVKVALQNISNHLIPGGNFLMSIQYVPGRAQETSNMPKKMQIEGGYEVIKDIREEGDMRIKERTLKKDGQLIGTITHKFFTSSLDRFREFGLCYGLQNTGFDPTQHLDIYTRK